MVSVICQFIELDITAAAKCVSDSFISMLKTIAASRGADFKGADIDAGRYSISVNIKEVTLQ